MDVAGEADASIDPYKAAYAAKRRKDVGYPEELSELLKEPCEKTCRSRFYDGSTLTSCRPPQKNASGILTLHCEWVYHGCVSTGAHVPT